MDKEMKKNVNATIETELIDYLNQISKTNKVSRSKALELVISLVQDYFTDDQIALEHNARGVIDRRFK